MKFTSLLFSLLCLLFISQNGQAQNTKFELNGTIIDRYDSPIPFASIAVSDQEENIIAGTVSENNGTFQLSLQPGLYLLKVQFLSYQTAESEIEIKDRNLSLGMIQMNPKDIDLDEIVVREEKSQTILQIDRRVFNVGKDLSNSGRNASDILDNVPGVSVDQEGNVSLRGNDNVRILIDGKPSGLISLNGGEGLRQIQGNMVEKIEVITNPSAKYDAEGEAGILNIVLLKERRKGINGSFELGTGFPDNHRASYNLNYRKNKLNFFSNFGVSYQKRPGNGNNEQYFYAPEDTLLQLSRREHERGGFGTNFKFGMDYFFNPKNTITMSGLYSYADGNNDASLHYLHYDVNLMNLEDINRVENEEETQRNIEFDIHYKKTFDNEKEYLTFDVALTESDDTEHSEFDEIGLEYSLFQKADNREDQQNWLFQTDLALQDPKERIYEFGAKANLRTIENEYTLFDLIDDEYVINDEWNNHFVFEEDVYSVYAMVKQKWDRFSVQLGSRLEYSEITTALLLTGERNPRDFLNLFPTAHFNYNINESTDIQWSYSRRVTRPNFWSLIPFVGFTDSRNIFSGNPDLNPEFSHSLETGILKRIEKGTILTSLYYRNTTDVMQRITSPGESGNTRFFPVNLGHQNALGLEFDFGYTPFEKIQLNLNANFFQENTTGAYEGQDLSNETFASEVKLNLKLMVTDRLDIQSGFNYKGPRSTPQGERKTVMFADFGASLDMLKNKATLGLSIKDAFNSRKRNSITDLENYYSFSEFQWRSRTTTLTFTYRLNDTSESKQKSR